MGVPTKSASAASAFATCRTSSISCPPGSSVSEAATKAGPSGARSPSGQSAPGNATPWAPRRSAAPT
eukprot:11019937-Alexandrium_andersonii.AAC.1